MKAPPRLGTIYIYIFINPFVASFRHNDRVLIVHVTNILHIMALSLSDNNFVLVDAANIRTEDYYRKVIKSSSISFCQLLMSSRFLSE